MMISYFKTKTAGLSNIGNTCFLNSCLQIMAHTFELNDILQRHKPNSTHLWDEWKILMMELWKVHPHEVVIQPRRFVYWVQRMALQAGSHGLEAWGQNDVSEFLLFFIDQLHKAIQEPMEVHIRGRIMTDQDRVCHQVYSFLQGEYAKGYSEVETLFYGVYLSQLRNPQTRHLLTSKPERFMTVDVPFRKSLQEGLENYVEEEVLEGSNAWYNEKTGHREPVLKSIRFFSLPKILVITIKRFQPGACSIPLRLDMSPYMVPEAVRKERIYDLYGVACHQGSIYRGGHYFAYVLNSVTGKWYMANDANVVAVPEPKMDSAYCLFYRIKEP
jgi:ubiquitin C-terminal hydrolase